MNLFRDKVAVVTGGASGIGRALCRELARLGAIVKVADINNNGAQETADLINTNGGRSRGIRLDVTRAEEVKQLIDDVVRENGRLDYMFNNAGIVVFGDARDMSLEHWQSQIQVNLMGVVYGAYHAYQQMAKQGYGHIVNTASMAGLCATPVIAPYTTTKFGVVGLSSALRAEGADLGVKVSVICPGFVRTGMIEPPVLNVDLDQLQSMVPDKYLWEPDQAAQYIIKGVARNRKIIAFPFYARLIWRLERFLPALANHLSMKSLRDFRKLRKVKK